MTQARRPDFDSRIALRSQRRTKQEQEADVGACLAAAYARVEGAPLLRQRTNPTEPPDLLFNWKGLLVGVELFELEGYYESRAILDGVTEAIYREFDQEIPDDRYRPLLISIPLTTRIETSTFLKVALRTVHRRLKDIPADLVRIVTETIPSTDAIPVGDAGRLIPVDRQRFPALHALAPSIIVTRHDGEPGPRPATHLPYVVPLGGATILDTTQIISIIERHLTRKARQLVNWVSVDHRILVAHDFPRDQLWQGAGMQWEPWVGIAAERARIEATFDELWLVPVALGDGAIGDGAANARRVLGKAPQMPSQTDDVEARRFAHRHGREQAARAARCSLDEGGV